MLRLPNRPTKACLLGFYLSIGLMAMLLCMPLAMLASFRIVSAIMVFVLAAILVCLGCHKVGLIFYKLWNKLRRYFAVYSRKYIIAICYFFIIVPTGTFLTMLKLERPELAESMWVPRKTIDPAAYQSLYGMAGDRLGLRSSRRSFMAWTLTSENLWACTLLPLLSLLSNLESEQEVEVSSDLYTLF